MMSADDNIALPFQLESSHLRGRLVRLGSVLDLILHQHAYPDPVGLLLAEAISIAVALASSLQYDGVFTLQAKGSQGNDGAVRMLVVDVTSEGGVRGYAQYDKDRLGDLPHHKLLGKGYLAFTCALTGKDDRYQGIVALEGITLAEAVQHYFKQSEQLPTGITASAHKDGHGRWRGGCLLLQRVPREGGININVETSTPEAEDWNRAMIVMGTCMPQELTDAQLGAEDLLFRLFHEEGVRVYDRLQLSHQCRCSEPRVEAMLKSLPRAEIEDMAIEGLVTVTCEFCNKSYLFDQARRDSLFTSGA